MTWLPAHRPNRRLVTHTTIDGWGAFSLVITDGYESSIVVSIFPLKPLFAAVTIGNVLQGWSLMQRTKS